MTLAGESKSAYKICVLKLKVNKPVGRYRCRWKDNIKMNVKWIVRMELYLAGSEYGMSCVCEHGYKP